MLADPVQLLRIARRAQWELGDVDLSADRAAWWSLPRRERVVLAELVAGFRVAEAAVAEHLAPFCSAAADPGVRALFALQAGDERRHAALFDRVAVEVCHDDPAAPRPALLELFGVRLPAVATALAGDSGHLADAVGLYHLVLEGLVFAVGQEALIERAAALPGLTDAMERVRRDERWHVGLGIRCLADLGGLVPPSETVVELALEAWGPEAATPERIAHARRVHARRLREAGALAAARP